MTPSKGSQPFAGLLRIDIFVLFGSHDETSYGIRVNVATAVLPSRNQTSGLDGILCVSADAAASPTVVGLQRRWLRDGSLAPADAHPNPSGMYFSTM